MTAKIRPWIADGLWLLAWSAASCAWCVSAAAQLGSTADESSYVIHGLERWRSGSYQRFMGMGTMPLAADVQTLPLYWRERCKCTTINPLEHWDRVLNRARLGTLLFWEILLVHGWLAGRSLGGPWGGRWAVALLACEPNLLAHAGLATTDLANTATLLALVYHFHRGRETRWLRRVLWPSMWFAATLLAKASGLVFGPVCMLVVGLEHALRRASKPADLSNVPTEAVPVFRNDRPGGLRTSFCRLAWDMIQVMGLGFLLALLYCGSDWHNSISLASWSQLMAEGSARRVLAWFASLPIFSNAAEGLLWQVLQNSQGTAAYLLGKVYPHGCWFYFPVGLTIKLNEAILVLALLLLFLRPRALLNWALLAAATLLALSSAFRVCNGIRQILPLIGLTMVGLAGTSLRAWQNMSPGWRRRLAASAGAAVLVWTAWSAIRVWPDGICYTNVLWGGTSKGYLCLNDSNYDWGQGLKQLDRWHRRHGRPPLYAWVFGNDPNILKMPVRVLQLGDLPVRGGEDVLALVRGHYLAVSVLWLHGYFDTPASRFLNSVRPVDRTATYFIYDFTSEGGS